MVSLLHFFFENYGLGEEHVQLHADNCSGQNKNNCMMQYLMWRVLTGWHMSIDDDSFPNTLSPPGLTPERKWYLFNEIRCFVSDEHKEKVAPIPDCSEPRKNVGREGDDDDDANLGKAGPSKRK